MKKIICVALVLSVLMGLSMNAFADSWQNTKNVPGTHLSSSTDKNRGYLESNVWHTAGVNSSDSDTAHEFDYQVSAYYKGLSPYNVDWIKTTWCMAVESTTTTNSAQISFTTNSGTVSASTSETSSWAVTGSKYWKNTNSYTSSWASNAYIYGKYANMYVQNTADCYYAGVQTEISASI